MKELRGKNAVVTGAGSGIGRGIARKLAERGVNVACLDLDEAAAKQTAEEISAHQVKAIGLRLDVTYRNIVYDTAAVVHETFPKVHILCNNAGIGSARMPIEETPDEDIDWIFQVNTLGVLHCIKAFVPKMKAHGEGGHVVNTASIAGLRMSPGMNQGLYAASKMAVVGFSENLKETLAAHNIGVSVLCPAGVNTNILTSSQRRPMKYGGPITREAPARMVKALAEGLQPDDVGKCVVNAIEDGEMFYILPHPQTRAWVKDRFDKIMEGFDRADRMVDELGIPRTAE